jgi:hypothetical protein
MPAIAVSVVTPGTDTLTATAHGLTTGDRFRLRNVGGALPAATPSLAAVTDYFALRVDANNLKICDTNAHALAGTGIVDITGSGSGTTTVEYGLPYCIPNVIAAPGTQVKSADLNGTWNSLVALYDLLTGQAESVWSGNIKVAGQFSGLGNNIGHGDRTDTILGADFKAASGTVTYSDNRIITSSAATLIARLPLRTGDRLKSITSLIGGDGSVDVTSYSIILYTSGGAPSTLASTSFSNLTSTDAPIDFTDTTLAAGQAVLIKVVANATLFALDDVRYTYDRPVS